MRKIVILILTLFAGYESFCWGFYGHRKINYLATFLLPPEMLLLYKPSIDFISEHAVDPDKRRYAVAHEGPRHYIDLDKYGKYPFEALPRKWNEAIEKYSEDSLMSHGIAPWWIQIMFARLTEAFKEKNKYKILKLSAEIGHYIADIHVPLHTNSNHNGQFTEQQGIHGFWESRIPELLADGKWDFFMGKADHISNPLQFIWNRILESAAASDSVLKFEKALNQKFPADKKYAFEKRNGTIVRQYSTAYAIAYDKLLDNMVERRMRQSIHAVASFWFSAWVNAGQPDLKEVSGKVFASSDLRELEDLNLQWLTGRAKGKTCD
jgi:hypothetical protein